MWPGGPQILRLDHGAKLFPDQHHQEMTVEQDFLEPSRQLPPSLHLSDREAVHMGQHQPHTEPVRVQTWKHLP